MLDLIREEQLHPGDKLPAERDLAAAMHVSRPVLREALRALAIMNVVDIRQGAGTYITSLEPQALVSHLDFVFSKDAVALAQVIETRRIVEVGNVRLAAARITPDELADPGRARRGPADRARGRGPVREPRHRRPRRGRGRGGQLPARAVHADHQHARPRSAASAPAPPGRPASARSRDIVAIVDALRAHDADAAALAMEAHLDHVEAALALAPRAATAPTKPAPDGDAVNVHGTHHMTAPRAAVFDAIRDPRVLLAVIPGCQAVEEVAPDEYEGRITLRLPGAVGQLPHARPPRRRRGAASAPGSTARSTARWARSRVRAAFTLAEDAAPADRHDDHLARHRHDPGPARPPGRPLRGTSRRIARRAGPPRPRRTSHHDHGGSRVTVSTYFQPTSVPEALALLGEHGPDLLVIAGGTVAMPLINEGISLPRLVMGLRRAGLDGIERTGDTLRIGAMTTLTALAEQSDAPLLRHGRPQDRELGRSATWRRSAATCSRPRPAGTSRRRCSRSTRRSRPPGRRARARSRWRRSGPGSWAPRSRTTSSSPRSRSRSTARRSDAFLKFGRKEANTPAVVTVAAHVTLDGGTVARRRIALGAVGPHPLRATSAEAALVGRAADDGRRSRGAAAAAVDDAEPFTDAVATDWYRRRMVGVIVERALTGLAAQAGRDA